MTRTERQQEAIKKWIKNKGVGTWEFPTAFGKTYTAITAIKAVRKKYPNLSVLVVVPTTTLKDQWNDELIKHELYFNIDVLVINTVIKHKYKYDMLIIDEIHSSVADTLKEVFNCVKYKLILGLTATFERLDGKHLLLNKYCPIIDQVSTYEALVNDWISIYKEYQVIIEVDDIAEYKRLNKEFIQYFEFFGYDFDKAMKTAGPEGWKYKLKLRDEMYQGKDESKRKEILQAITINSVGLMRVMQKRKAFINNHPKKIEIAKKIMKARPDAKIITFSNNVNMAEALENGENVYTGKTSKKVGRVMIEDYLSGKINHLHSVKKLIEGFNDPNTNVAIILGLDSSERRATQTRGRVIRKTTTNKQAEIFNIVIKDTQETKWFDLSHKKTKDYITIDEKGLEQVLRGEQPEPYKKKIGEILFRF